MKKLGKISIVVFALMALVVGIHSTGQAAVSNNLIFVPTANIISNQGAIAGEMYGDLGRFEAVYRLDPRVEIGGEIISNDNGDSDIGPLLRILFSRETADQPAFAAGLRDKDLYATVSKSLGYGVNGHIGIGDGAFDGLFVGLNKVINPVSIEIDSDSDDRSTTVTSSFPTTNLMVEYINQKVNFGARINLQNTLNLDLGVLDLDEFKLGLNYGF